VKFSLKIFPLSFVLLSQTVNAVSEEDDLPTLIVSASRSDSVSVPHASSIKVISREEIELSGAKSIPELLRGQPGIYVSDFFGDGSNASIDMRGFGSTANANTLIMIDGRKLNFATDSGTLYFNAIDLDNVEQVEITQGSAGVLFGNMAVGGVINIITRKPTDDVIEASLDIGSYNSHKERIRLENLHANGWSSRLVLINKESDNYRDHNDAETGSASLRLDKRFESGRFFAEYEYLDDYIQTPGALFLDEIAEDRQQSVDAYADDYQSLINNLIRFGSNYQLNNENRLEADVTYQDAEREFFSSSRFGPNPFSTQERNILDMNVRWLHTFASGSIVSGVDFQKTDYSLVSFATQKVDQNIAGLYSNLTFEIADNINLIAGYRIAKVWNDIYFRLGPESYTDIDDDVSVGNVGLTYTSQDGLTLYSRIEQNYRFAKVEEHTNTVDGVIGLDTQKGTNYEIGFQKIAEKFSISGSLFYLDLEDEISFGNSTQFIGATGNMNLDATRRQGLSLYGDYAVNENWHIGGGFDYVDAQVTSGDFSGSQVPEVAEKRLNVFTDYMLNENLTLKLDGQYIGERYYGGDFENDYSQMSSFTLFNLSSIYNKENYSINFKINNLFDKTYSEYGVVGFAAGIHPQCLGIVCPSEMPSPERNLWLGVKVNLSD